MRHHRRHPVELRPSAATMTQIVDQVNRALVFAHRRFPSLPIMLIGHSAGGHLVVGAWQMMPSIQLSSSIRPQEMVAATDLAAQYGATGIQASIQCELHVTSIK